MIVNIELDDATLDRIATRVVEKLRAASGSSEFVDQDTCAPISKRVFLRAAGAGAFPSSRVGKRVLVRRADFEAWLASHPTVVGAKPVAAPITAPATRAERLARAGFKIAGAR